MNQARSRFVAWRRIIAGALGLLVLLIGLGVAGLMLLGPYDLTSTMAGRLTRSLGRPVTIGKLEIHPGRTVIVELRDLAIETVPGGSAQPFLKLARLDAEIGVLSLVGWALLDHPPTIRRLSIAGAALSMEHGSDGRANWHLGDRAPASPADRRARAPIVLDGHLQDGAVQIHTSSGKVLQIRCDDLVIATPAADQAVTLTANGTYNEAPLRLSATLQSFDRLQGSAPFGAEVHLASDETRADFTGTMTDPLAADGIAGRLTLTAPSLDRVLAMAGATGQVALPVTLGAGFRRDGDLWRLADGDGALGGQPFTLAAQLQEGPRGAPDAITLDAGLGSLDLAAVQGRAPAAEAPLRIDAEPGTRVDAHVTAKQLVYHDWRAEDVELTAKLAPGALAVDQLKAHVFGGTAALEGSMTNSGTGVVLRLDGSLAGADASALSGLLAIGPLPLRGAVDVRLGLDATGATLHEAGRSVGGGLVLAMAGGTIGRAIVERASTDLRLLFRKSEGSGRIDCLVGVLALRDGIGKVAPLRLRSSDGTILGSGTLDLRRGTIDFTFGTESATTSVFALDVPVRVAGPIGAPGVLPALGRPDPAAVDLAQLPPAVQALARANPCIARN